MGANIYLNTKNHERTIKAGFKASDFVNEVVEKELNRMELEAQGD